MTDTPTRAIAVVLGIVIFATAAYGNVYDFAGGYVVYGSNFLARVDGDLVELSAWSEWTVQEHINWMQWDIDSPSMKATLTGFQNEQTQTGTGTLDYSAGFGESLHIQFDIAMDTTYCLSSPIGPIPVGPQLDLSYGSYNCEDSMFYSGSIVVDQEEFSFDFSLPSTHFWVEREVVFDDVLYPEQLTLHSSELQWCNQSIPWDEWEHQVVDTTIEGHSFELSIYHPVVIARGIWAGYPVPEPCTLTLLAVGAAFLCSTRRKSSGACQA